MSVIVHWFSKRLVRCFACRFLALFLFLFKTYQPTYCTVSYWWWDDDDDDGNDNARVTVTLKKHLKALLKTIPYGTK